MEIKNEANSVISEAADLPKAQWKLTYSEKRLGFLWVSTLIGGCFFIWKSSSLSLDESIKPVVFMLIYAAYGMVLEKKNTTKFADSLYFMGFLWTLWALYVLFFHKEVRGNTVFQAFGYALITTMSGMFFRLIIIQFQETIPDRIVSAQEEIDLRVSAFTEELRKSTEAIQTFNKIAPLTLTKQLSLLTDSLGNTRKDFEASFETPKERIKSESAKLIQQIAKSIERFEAATSQIEKQYLESADRIGSAATVFSEKINSLQVPADLLSSKILELIDQLQLGFNKINTSIESASLNLNESISGMVKPEVISEIGRSFNQLNTHLNTLSEECRTIKTFGEDVEKVSERMLQIDQGILKFLGSIDLLEKQVARLSSEAITLSADRILQVDKTIEEAHKTGEKLQATVTDVLNFARRHLT